MSNEVWRKPRDSMAVLPGFTQTFFTSLTRMPLAAVESPAGYARLGLVTQSNELIKRLLGLFKVKRAALVAQVALTLPVSRLSGFSIQRPAHG